MLFYEMEPLTELLMGCGITFGLALVITFLTKKDYMIFLIWAMVISAFCVEAHLLPLWAFVALLLAVVFLTAITYSLKKQGSKINYEYIALASLIMLSFLNIIFGGTWLGFSLEGAVAGDLEVEGSIAVDDFWGIILVLITFMALCALYGIQLFGSGLAETSIKYLTTITMYVALWGLFSLLSSNLILNIPIFGASIWLVLTFVYAIGVIKKITGSDN